MQHAFFFMSGFLCSTCFRDSLTLLLWCSYNKFFFIDAYYSIAWLSPHGCMPFTVGGYLDCLHLEAIMDNAAINILFFFFSNIFIEV